MSIPNVRSAIGSASAEAMLAVAKALGIQLTYTHEPGKVGASSVLVWAQEVSNLLASRTFPQLGLLDGETKVVNVPNQATAGDGVFVPSTGDEAVWESKKYFVLMDGRRLDSGAGYVIILGRTNQKMIGI